MYGIVVLSCRELLGHEAHLLCTLSMLVLDHTLLQLQFWRRRRLARWDLPL